ncbi:MAG: diaminopropionate ammonia-lyase, partial [Solirubrobacteraceae bacterium]
RDALAAAAELVLAVEHAAREEPPHRRWPRSARIRSDVRRIAARRDAAAVPTWSGAGHDTQHLAALTPTLLVFVPLEGGESHTPQQGAADRDITAAG